MPQSIPGAPANGFLPGEQLQLADVYLLTNDASGPIAIPGLGLAIDPIAITLIKPNGEVGAVMPWSQVRSLSARERSTTPEGSPALLVEVTDSLKTHRFVVPADDPDGLELALIAFSSRTTSPRPARSELKLRPILVGAVLVVVAAAVTVLLLASAGAI
jgi:hypothetical protein